MMNRVEQEKQDIDYIRQQLEGKLKTNERKCKELQRGENEREEIGRKNVELEETQHESRKLIRQKENQIEKYRTILKDQTVKKSTQVGDGEATRILKEELCKKQFMLRQANSKLNEAQNELREISRKFQFQKETMKRQIHEMEKIIQDNFDHTNGSNKLIESALV